MIVEVLVVVDDVALLTLIDIAMGHNEYIPHLVLIPELSDRVMEKAGVCLGEKAGLRLTFGEAVPKQSNSPAPPAKNAKVNPHRFPRRLESPRIYLSCSCIGHVPLSSFPDRSSYEPSRRTPKIVRQITTCDSYEERVCNPIWNLK
jgi:hypothetical protein